MRAVFADPIAPQYQQSLTGGSPQAPRAGVQSTSTSRTSPRSNNTVSRTGGATNIKSTNNVVQGRNVSSRTSKSGSQQSVSRNVVNRNVSTSRTTSAQNRTVRSRAATTQVVDKSRVSLTGSAIRGSKST
ncbi:MAG: hypothetical protein JXL97_15775, partial [Bacteroidales bacterium]|nr:hypothetical protein [Bacteroidales bacterium]